MQPRVSHPKDWLPCMEIVPFQASYLPEAAALFVESFKRLRAEIGVLPDRLEDAAQVMARLEQLTDGGFAAVEQGKLIGYLGGFVIERFRDTDAEGAYCPEWGHAAAEQAAPPKNGRLSIARCTARRRPNGRRRAAAYMRSRCWRTNRTAQNVWFWQGFGMVVVDAIRPITPLGNAAPDGLAVRQATPNDAERLAVLDVAH